MLSQEETFFSTIIKKKIDWRDTTNKPAWLIRRRSRRQRLHREELFAALHCVNTGAGQRKGSGWPCDAHTHGNDQGLGYVAQLLHCVGEQSLEDSPALSNRLRDEVAAQIKDTKYKHKGIHQKIGTASSRKKKRSWTSHIENIDVSWCSYFFFLDEAISTLRMTNTRATERRNLLVTCTASSLRPGVYLFCSSFTSVPSKVSMN